MISDSNAKIFKPKNAREIVSNTKLFIEDNLKYPSVIHRIFIKCCTEKGMLLPAKIILKHLPNQQKAIDESLFMACSYGNIEGVKFLLQHNAFEYDVDNHSFFLACNSGQTDIVKLLIESKHDVPIHDGLVNACHNGHIDTIKLLIEIGADVHTNFDRPIMEAIANGEYNTVKFLLNYVTPTNVMINYAKSEGYKRITKLLQKHART